LNINIIARCRVAFFGKFFVLKTHKKIKMKRKEKCQKKPKSNANIVAGGGLPKSSRLMVDGAGEAASRLRCQVGGQRWHSGFSTARIVGKLDGDGFGGAFWNGAVQLFDGLFGLLALVEADEADTFGETCEDEMLYIIIYAFKSVYFQKKA
jgi:hypothetical protein